MKKAIFLMMTAFLVITPGLFSQFQPTPVKRSNNQITINGKDFYLHEVEKGQTLYGISKEYKVSEDEIKNLNPDLKTKSVFPGMVLRIPDAGKAGAVAISKESGSYIEHIVQAKETFFSVSRQYGIRVEEIKDSNPDTKGGLKIGQILRIPKDKITITQQSLPSENKKADTNQIVEKESVGDLISSQPCKLKPFPHENENFRLAILLPLNINQNDTLNYNDTLRVDYFRFYEFLEGVYLAIDSMRLEGLNMTVEIFDTEKDPERIRKIIDDGRIKDADLIIGPVFQNEIEVVGPYAKSRQIPMVSPLSTSDVVKGNPYAFQVRNKLPRQIELATSYLGTKYNQNPIIVGRISEKNNPDFIRFQNGLAVQVKEHDPAKKAIVKTIYFNESSRTFTNAESKAIQLDSYLSASVSSYLIIPSEDEVFVTELINQLNIKAVTNNIHVFGLNQWVYKDLDLGNLYNVNLELYCDFEDQDEPFVDYSDPQVLNFCAKFKENWKAEPSKYSFQGFDIAYYFTSALFQFGRNLTSSVPCWNEYLTQSSILTPMKFQSAGSTSGFDNHALTVVKYQKDELQRKKVR